MSKDIPHREEQEHTLADAREQGTSLTKLRLGGSSAYRWQVHLIDYNDIQWDEMSN